MIPLPNAVHYGVRSSQSPALARGGHMARSAPSDTTTTLNGPWESAESDEIQDREIGTALGGVEHGRPTHLAAPPA